MVNATPSPQPVMPSRIDYKFKRVPAAAFPPHPFTQNDSSPSSSHDPSAAPSPTHHKQSSLSLHQPPQPFHTPLPQPFPSLYQPTETASSSLSAPPTTTHGTGHTRFPALGPPRPFSSAQSYARVRIVRAEDDDEAEGDEEGDGAGGSAGEGLSETGSAFSAFSRSREELDKMRDDRAARVQEDERRLKDEKARHDKVTAIAQKTSQLRLQAASAERARRKEEEDELRAVVEQVQKREEKQRRDQRPKPTKCTEQRPGQQEQAVERRQGQNRQDEEEKQQVEKTKEASMRREHSHGAFLPNKLNRDSQAASPPPRSSLSVSPSPSAPLQPPNSAATKRPVRSDLLASSLPTNPSYYPSHVHSLLSSTFLPPLSRLFKHYHQRAPASSASPAYVDMAGGLRATLLSPADWLLMMGECAVSGVLLPKDALKRLYMAAVRTERKAGAGGEVGGDGQSGDGKAHGLGLGRFLKSLWCVARSVGGGESVDQGGSGKQEVDLRVMLALLEYVRHHATPQRMGAQLKLQWPDITLKEAVDLHVTATPRSTESPPQQPKPTKRREEKKPAFQPTQATNTDHPSTTPAATTPPPRTQFQLPAPLVPTTTATTAPTPADLTAEQQRKDRKRQQLKAQVEHYRRQQEAKEAARIEEERARKAEEEEREVERRRREERVREEEKRRIAEFKARRREEVEEMARAEAEKAEREERERKRALELYMRQKAERKRREEAEQRQRLMHFHQQMSAQEAADDDEDKSKQQEQPGTQKAHSKRRQWDKQPSQNLDSTAAVSQPLDTLHTYSSPPVVALTQTFDDRGDIRDEDLMSLGHQSVGMDGIGRSEEKF